MFSTTGNTINFPSFDTFIGPEGNAIGASVTDFMKKREGIIDGYFDEVGLLDQFGDLEGVLLKIRICEGFSVTKDGPGYGDGTFEECTDGENEEVNVGMTVVLGLTVGAR